MAEPQLSVRSAKARDLARRLARREHRSIADVVERALEAYEIREAGREPASAFYAHLANDYGSDLDLEAVIRENRKTAPGPEFWSSSVGTSSSRRRAQPCPWSSGWCATMRRRP